MRAAWATGAGTRGGASGGGAAACCPVVVEGFAAGARAGVSGSGASGTWLGAGAGAGGVTVAWVVGAEGVGAGPAAGARGWVSPGGTGAAGFGAGAAFGAGVVGATGALEAAGFGAACLGAAGFGAAGLEQRVRSGRERLCRDVRRRGRRSLGDRSAGGRGLRSGRGLLAKGLGGDDGPSALRCPFRLRGSCLHGLFRRRRSDGRGWGRGFRCRLEELLGRGREGGRGGGFGLELGRRALAGHDAVDERLAVRIEPHEAHGHAGAGALGAGPHHHALAAQQAPAIGEHQLEGEPGALGLGRARGDEESPARDVRAVLLDEVLLRGVREADAQREQLGLDRHRPSPPPGGAHCSGMRAFSPPLAGSTRVSSGGDGGRGRLEDEDERVALFQLPGAVQLARAGHGLGITGDGVLLAFRRPRASPGTAARARSRRRSGPPASRGRRAPSVVRHTLPVPLSECSDSSPVGFSERPSTFTASFEGGGTSSAWSASWPAASPARRAFGSSGGAAARGRAHRPGSRGPPPGAAWPGCGPRDGGGSGLLLLAAPGGPPPQQRRETTGGGLMRGSFPSPARRACRAPRELRRVLAAGLGHVRLAAARPPTSLAISRTRSPALDARAPPRPWWPPPG